MLSPQQPPVYNYTVTLSARQSYSVLDYKVYQSGSNQNSKHMTLDLTNIGRRMSYHHCRFHSGQTINRSSNFTLDAVEVESQPVTTYYNTRHYCTSTENCVRPVIRPADSPPGLNSRSCPGLPTREKVETKDPWIPTCRPLAWRLKTCEAYRACRRLYL